MAGADTIERLRLFLRELSPQARSMLIAEFERTLLRGEDLGSAELVLQELRRLARDQREDAPRVGHSARLFFKPLEPFLVDDLGQHRHLGRISRSSLDGLWTWISRDVLPEDATAVDKIVNAAVLDGDTDKANYFVRAFQDRVAVALSDQLRNAYSDDKMRRRMLALLTVMNRLSAPWQLIRLGVKAAGSDTAARVAETPYGMAVTIVLSELERQVGELRDDLRSGRGVAVGALLKTIHDSARGLRTELNMPMDSSWGRALSGLRSQIGDTLRLEIDSMPGRVRRLLKPRAVGEIRPNSTLDPTEVAETEALVTFVGTCRHFAGELAINEMTQRTFSELQQYLDNATRGLLEALRNATPSERSFRQSQVDTAVRLCATVFGRDYAAQLGKAAEIAAAAERKAARG